MSKHDPRVILQQLRDAARQAESLCQGRTLQQLQADRMRTLAFERCLGIVATTIKRLPANLRERYDSVDWQSITDASDIAMRDYDSVNHEILWKAVHTKFPALFATIEQMLADLGGELPMEEQASGS